MRASLFAHAPIAPIAVRAIATQAGLAVRLRRSSLPEVLDALSSPRVKAAPLEVVERAITASDRVLERLPFVPNTCLYRSLARYAVLRRAGHEARFVMAIDPTKPDLVGHAWVELDGKPHGEEIEPGFVVTFAYPPGRTQAVAGGAQAPS